MATINLALAYITEADLPCHGHDCEHREVDHEYARWLGIWGYYIAAGAITIALDNQLSGNDALSDLSPSSDFMAEAAARRGDEQLGALFAMQGNIGMGYMGGPLRLAYDRVEAEQRGWEAYYLGAELMYIGGEYIWSYPWETVDGLYELLLGSAMMDLGLQLVNLGPWWTDDVVGGYPHDAIVPVSRQYVAGATPVIVPNVSHVEETNAPHSRQQIRLLIDQITQQ